MQIVFRSESRPRPIPMCTSATKKTARKSERKRAFLSNSVEGFGPEKFCKTVSFFYISVPVKGSEVFF